MVGTPEAITDGRAAARYVTGTRHTQTVGLHILVGGGGGQSSPLGLSETTIDSPKWLCLFGGCSIKQQSIFDLLR